MSRPFLFDAHHRELVEGSAIDEQIVVARGYRSVGRPTNTNDDPRQEMKRLGIPTWATAEDRYFPGLLIPLYRPNGERISAMFKPRVAVTNRDGKLMKYAAVKNRPSTIDVHPINRDRIVDITVPLWITEGVKKADALASRGLCVAALSGVFNWRSTMGALGDWEDIPLRGRQTVICYDADARTNPNVLRAMVRFGHWLRSKGVASVHYLIVPDHHEDHEVKGADDWFAAGGSLEQLKAAGTTTEPRPDNTDDTFTDARLAETLADEVLDGGYCWASGLGWLRWDGTRWKDCTDVAVLEAVRRYSLARFAAAARDPQRNSAALDGWRAMLSASRERAVLGLARGIVERDAAAFDAQPDLLNTPSGVIDMETGDVLPHDPDLLMIKITGAQYRPGADHPDWDQALRALPDEVRDYLQVRLGQAITGHMTPDDILVVMHGGGDNGKSTLAEVNAAAVGDYFLMVSDRALMANPDAHPTELMDFKGARYAVLEETPEARRLNTQRLKRTIGTPRITARHIRQDSVTFPATHSLFINTNHKPNVEESDHGTWRRLALVTFPYRFRKPYEALETPNDRHGDSGLRDRCKTNPEVWAAALAWMVDGARKWYAADKVMPEPPAVVLRDTRAWRGESDQVMAYINERIVFDPDRHVLSVELLDDFNAWLKMHGHVPWSDKTFIARLDGHDEVGAHKIERKKIRARNGLSRPPVRGGDWDRKTYAAATASVYAAWLGLRFAEDGDLEPEEMSESVLTRQSEDHVPGVTGEKYNQISLTRDGLYFPAVTSVTVDVSQDRVTGVTDQEKPPEDDPIESVSLDAARSYNPTLCDRCGHPTHAYGHYRECLRPQEEP